MARPRPSLELASDRAGARERDYACASIAYAYSDCVLCMCPAVDELTDASKMTHLKSATVRDGRNIPATAQSSRVLFRPKKTKNKFGEMEISIQLTYGRDFHVTKENDRLKNKTAAAWDRPVPVGLSDVVANANYLTSDQHTHIGSSRDEKGT